MTFPHQKKACSECPWRKSNPPGKFTSQRYRDLAGTAEDMSVRVFACHMRQGDKPAACAGWLRQQGGHSLTVRLQIYEGNLDPSLVEKIPDPYKNYREMAIANGVAPDDPCLAAVRNDGQYVMDEE